MDRSGRVVDLALCEEVGGELFQAVPTHEDVDALASLTVERETSERVVFRACRHERAAVARVLKGTVLIHVPAEDHELVATPFAFQRYRSEPFGGHVAIPA